MVKPGLINLDFADIRTVMREMGKAMMGTGEATGDRRAIEAAEAAISNPLLDDVSLKGARALLINITGGPDMTLFEVDEAANRVREEVDPDANIIFGSTFNDEMVGKMRVSVVATGIDAQSMSAAQKAASLMTEPKKPYSFNPAPAPVAVKAPEPVVKIPARPLSFEPPPRPVQPQLQPQPEPQAQAPAIPQMPGRFSSEQRAATSVQPPYQHQPVHYQPQPQPVQVQEELPPAPPMRVRMPDFEQELQQQQQAPALQSQPQPQPQLQMTEPYPPIGRETLERPQPSLSMRNEDTELAREESGARGFFRRMADVGRSLTPARPEVLGPHVALLRCGPKPRNHCFFATLQRKRMYTLH
jgi:cell division protein FtsZ